VIGQSRMGVIDDIIRQNNNMRSEVAQYRAALDVKQKRIEELEADDKTTMSFYHEKNEKIKELEESNKNLIAIDDNRLKIVAKLEDQVNYLKAQSAHAPLDELNKKYWEAEESYRAEERRFNEDMRGGM